MIAINAAARDIPYKSLQNMNIDTRRAGIEPASEALRVQFFQE
ncbi:MAG: hypothetical protein ACRETU_07990 [Steroidobacterales bacterium]